MSDDWKYKMASILAFSSILEGPQEDNIKGLVSTALSAFTQMLNYSHPKI